MELGYDALWCDLVWLQCATFPPVLDIAYLRLQQAALLVFAQQCIPAIVNLLLQSWYPQFQLKILQSEV